MGSVDRHDDASVQQSTAPSSHNNDGEEATATTNSMEDPITAADLLPDDTHAVSSAEDVWATGQGYTPLHTTTTSTNHHHTLRFSNGPSDSSDDDDDDTNDPVNANGNAISMAAPAFYANLRAMGVNHHTNDNQEEDDNMVGATTLSTSNNNDDDFDFRSVADKALSVLDEEYRRVVEATPISTTTSSLTADATPLVEHCKHDNDDNDNNHGTAKTTTPTLFVADFESSLSSERLASTGSEDGLGALVEQPSALPTSATTTAKPPPNQPMSVAVASKIDTSAVRRAVEAIQQQQQSSSSTTTTTAPPHATFHTRYETWRQRQIESTSTTIPTPVWHPWIPPAPLAAFSKYTAKARRASANLSRSATLIEALYRLWQWPPQLSQTTTTTTASSFPNGTDNTALCLHIVGCDHVECATPDHIRTLFGPFVRWLGSAAAVLQQQHNHTNNNPTTPSAKTKVVVIPPIRHVRLELIGPNVPTAAVQTGPVDLLPLSSSSTTTLLLQSATAECHCAVYEDWRSQPAAVTTTTTTTARLADNMYYQRGPPDLCIAFNAGVWGYREWKTTLEYLVARPERIPFLCTAYTLEEAEDDQEVIEGVVRQQEDEMAASAGDVEVGPQESSSSSSLSSRPRQWFGPTSNPFASRLDRETANAAPGRVYRENAAWQAWYL